MTHERLRQRDQMRRKGIEDIAGKMPAYPGKPRPRAAQPTREAMRREADLAYETWRATRASS